MIFMCRADHSGTESDVMVAQMPAHSSVRSIATDLQADAAEVRRG